MSFSNILVTWYLQNKRDLPWRETKNPYYIWLSEIILQQTRVNQGLDYYLKFIEEFPTVYDLARAEEKAVLKLWQGLGYYSRARNLHYSAKHIVNSLDGKFPTTYEGLLTLKGVGDYTASAIASICYGAPTAVVDGNVYRVLARHFGLKTAINSSKGIKEFKRLAQTLIDKENPSTFNQAIMEFGAVQCKPQNPECLNCPLNNTCYALKHNMIRLLPTKEKKIQIKKRYFNYLVVRDKSDKTLIKERTGQGIWRGLYEFPLIETNKNINVKELISMQEFAEIFPENAASISLFNKVPIVHKLTHQHLHTNFWILNSQGELEQGVLWEDFGNYPVPILIHNFVENFRTKASFF